MKRLITTLGLILLLVLVGCTGAPATPTTPPPSASPTTPAPATSPPPATTPAPTPTPSPTPSPSPTPTPSPALATLALTSAAFKDGDTIPVKYTCQGDNVSPPLSWNAPPQGTQSLALITEDLDGPSGIITHWIIFNMPANTRELAEAVPNLGQLANGTLQGNNVRGNPGYTGPCPPAGGPHRYRFTLYALDQSLSLPSGISRNDFLAAIRAHVLAQGQITGTYQRQA